MDYTEKIKEAVMNGEDINALIASLITSEVEKQANKVRMSKARDEIIYDAIEAFHEKDNIPSDLRKYKSELITFINQNIQLDNNLGTHEKYKIVTKLGVGELIYILPHLYNFRVVKRSQVADFQTAELMVQTEGGWFEEASRVIMKTSTTLAPDIKIKSDIPDIIEKIKLLIDKADVECTCPDNTPLVNGIFNKKYWEEHGELKPYTDKEIYTNPFGVKFNPNATNPEINIDGKIFNVEDWLLEIAGGDEDIKKLFWNVFSALLHPNRKYKKCVMLFSPIGNNGKGTFLELCRNIVGKELCMDMSIDGFSDKNLLVNVADARLVAGDENPVDLYIDNATSFKNCVSADPVTVDRKYKNALSFTFHGLIMQCMNSMPLTKDKTNSFYRRLLPVPFNANFEGVENDDIKSKYIKNKDVLEYIVNKALMIDLEPEALESPEAAVNLLESYKENNDTILQWWNDFDEDLAWDRVPFRLLFGCYRYYMKNYSPRGDINVTKSKFVREFKLKILPKLTGWTIPNDTGVFAVTTEMRTTPEPLIAKYEINDLKNPDYVGKDWDKIGIAGKQLKNTERGIVKEDGYYE